MSSARNAGESAICQLRAQPSAEIVRVECAKRRRECDLPAARATLCGDRACRAREMQARVRFAGCARNPLQRSCVSSARNAGESAICRLRAQPSAEIARVERAKCRRECDVPAARATLCGDRACRAREMQARARWGVCTRNSLRRSCVSSARNAGESAIYRLLAQPSAEIVRVECAECWRECDWVCAHNPLRRSCVSSARNAGESAVGCERLCGDWACRARERQARGVLCSITSVRGVAGELEDENWRLGSATLVRGVAGEWEDENWRLCSTTLVRGVSGELEDENW